MLILLLYFLLEEKLYQLEVRFFSNPKVSFTILNKPISSAFGNEKGLAWLLIRWMATGDWDEYKNGYFLLKIADSLNICKSVLVKF